MNLNINWFGLGLAALLLIFFAFMMPALLRSDCIQVGMRNGYTSEAIERLCK